MEPGNGNGRRRAVPRKAPAPALGGLFPAYTFDNFVVGSANQGAHQAARSVVARPGRCFNPLFLQGGVGLGETHLPNAIGHAMLARPQRVRIACLAAETFTNTMIRALQTGRMDQFRERFRRVDALMLDDVEFLAGKERTQEEFFHTFNTLYEHGKQIVLTADQPPMEITGLGPRLRSRFEGGLIATMYPLTREMRSAIIQAKAKARGLSMDREVVELLTRRSGPTER